MSFLAAIAIGLFGWVTGLGLAGAGAAWLPAPVVAWRAQDVLGPIPFDRPAVAGSAPATLAAPWSGAYGVATGAAAATPVAHGPLPHAAGALPRAAGPRPPAERPVTAPLPPAVGRPSGPPRPAVPFTAPAVRPAPRTASRHAAPAPPPGSFMTQAEYARAIALRLARSHPELAPGVRREIAGAIAERALAWGLDPWLVYADIRIESGFRPDTVGEAGEIGLMQVLPSTARMVARQVLGIEDFPARRLYDPAWNVRLGTAYLGLMMERHRGDLAVALAAYNAGVAVAGPTAYTYRVLGVFRRVDTARPALAGRQARTRAT